MGIYDILSSDITQVGQADFTAAEAAGDDVAVNNVTAPNGLSFFDASGNKFFLPGEKLLIKKLWVSIPWGFGQGAAADSAPIAHRIALAFRDGADIGPIGPFFNGLAIPTLCTPIDFGAGLFAELPVTGVKWSIQLTDLQLRISQVNMPSVLEGKRVPVQYFMEVLHNVRMVA